MVNFLLIDVYYSKPQIALFKSTKFLNKPYGKKYEDVEIKNIMYCTKNNEKDTDFEVKCLTQYATFF